MAHTIAPPRKAAREPGTIPAWCPKVHRILMIIGTAGGCLFFEPLPEKKPEKKKWWR
jgi:hypothetical protein